MAVPDEPELDPVTAYLLNVFRNVCRGRQYIASVSGAFPMRLGYREINDFLAAHPSPLPRHFVDEVVFALDDIVMTEEREK
ncbi:hypothetical protein NJC40_03440 [Pseudomonas sp. 21LCFQ02]|uniref:hypothetical protein n=1 Tax=Pseudomonas sp. 21LCFQ02 TaxID=2957505 RepID=UPI00209ABBE4|nr:hypothetical protein [Pseudomonas sp. 21LCFQ02]MCO8166831.1 hypothetical protein [Pseudomonas sp. 21LCFQ02]